MKALNLRSHSSPEASIKVAEGLIKQEDVWLLREGTSEGNALLLSAAKLARLAVQKVAHVEHLRDGCHPRLDLSAWTMLKLEAKSYVVEYTHVRV